MELQIPSPIQAIQRPVIDALGMELFIKREDAIHPVVSGNKFRKLKYVLAEAESLGATKVLSYGGLHSNHLHALAWACGQKGLACELVIRGEELHHSDMLHDARRWGAQVRFVPWDDYDANKQFEPFLDADGCYHLPEGGKSSLARRGVAELVAEIDLEFDYICCPVGTGATALGLLDALGPHQVLIACSVQKKDQAELAEIKAHATASGKQVLVLEGHHFGGFAKMKKPLVEFMNWFRSDTGVLLDPIYTAKMMYALETELPRLHIARGSRIVCVHTGGLQGIAAMNRRLAPRGLHINL